jgi:hypothetical protein
MGEMSQNARFWKLSTSPVLILADLIGLELSALSGSRVPLVMFLCLYGTGQNNSFMSNVYRHIFYSCQETHEIRLNSADSIQIF